MMSLNTMVKIIIITIALIIGIGSIFIGKYKGQINNPIEQAAEKVVDLELGIDIGLSSNDSQKK